MTNHREDARDLVAETVLCALERFGELREEKAFLSWLFTIAVRLHRRAQWRKQWFGLYNQHQAETQIWNGGSPELSYDLAVLNQALAQLPPRDREAIVMFEIAGLTLAEIQQVQGGSLSGVKSRLVRGRKKLAAILKVPQATKPQGWNQAKDHEETEHVNYAGIDHHE